MLTLGSLFDGIGVFPLAARTYGITPLWASEIEKAPISITMRHFPDMAHLGDITKLHGGEIPPVDVLTFGSPCQNLSQIGWREGLSGEKSNLFFEAMRIVREMREVTHGAYPTVLVWENVAGAFSANNGLDFRAVLRAVTGADIPMPDTGKWAPAGMVFGGVPCTVWRTLDAQYWGSPRLAQRRRRVFLVADFGGRRAPEILFDPAPMHEAAAHGPAGGDPLSAGAGNHSRPPGRDPPQVYSLQMRKMRGAVQHGRPDEFHTAIGPPDAPCPTLLAAKPQPVIVRYPDAPERSHARYLTPTEEERLMGLPEGWTAFGHDDKAVSDSARYRALGNAIALPCALYIMRNIERVIEGGQPPGR